MDEKGVFIQIQNTIVSSKALVLVNNCLNTFVHDCCILYRSKHKCFDYTNKGPLDKSGISMKNILKLQSVQNLAARTRTSTRKYDHIQLILRDLNWLNVESTVKYRDGIMVFKCVNGYIPEYLCDQFILQSKIHSRNTRNKDKLAIPLCKTAAAGQKSFVYHATSIWNSLSQGLINLNNLNSFKRLYKLSLLEQ